MTNFIVESIVNKQNSELSRRKSTWKTFCRLFAAGLNRQPTKSFNHKAPEHIAKSEVEWLNTSTHQIAKGFRVLKAMADQLPQDKLLQEHMKRAVLKARQLGLTNNQRQNLAATEELWDQW